MTDEIFDMQLLKQMNWHVLMELIAVSYMEKKIFFLKLTKLGSIIYKIKNLVDEV